MRKINPADCFLLLLLLLVISNFVFPIKNIIVKPYNYFGVLFIILGISLKLWVYILFKNKKTTLKPEGIPTALITEGPFKISRHPMYFGMMLILFGAAICFGDLVTFIFPVIFFVIIELYFIPLEEKNLKDKFKQKYHEYKKKVRRWV